MLPHAAARGAREEETERGVRAGAGGAWAVPREPGGGEDGGVRNGSVSAEGRCGVPTAAWGAAPCACDWGCACDCDGDCDSDGGCDWDCG